MTVTARRFTVDEVLAWPDDGNRYELVEGVLLVTPSPAPLHQILATRLMIGIGARIPRDAKLYVTGPGDIILRPHLLMEPDILVFHTASLRSKWEAITDHRLAVEVFSPSSRIYDREVKRDAYLQIGVPEVWLVDADAKVVYVSRIGGPIDVAYHSSLPVHLGDPGADPIDLAEVFRGLE